jgi:hypothetical protein
MDSRPRSREDGMPPSGVSVQQEINAIRYELTVRLPKVPGSVFLILRIYENGEVGMSTRYTR